ncbi:ComEA family DNA-binding protein [Alcanivorax quisquiliarum]|uniref:ComEA family DNA-binding protein n=1 Tax=Alcanivorax quisquiliarum TaxID=2933565 RepID=A0ABT0EA30_9GAMM|nr:ComEA family DNA-binding protein [Alcanivorax quisquiliarum]MCK0538702.1 ComEA family DNA-binding protein [Alcanivorax quisquiliarum]
MMSLKGMLWACLLALGLASTPALAEPAIDAIPIVNINQAGAEELAEALTGIGLARAQAIVADREQNGAYQSADELARVRGIGANTIERNRARIRTE